MGQPSYSPPPRKQRLFAYSWQCKVDIFTSQGGERIGPKKQRLFAYSWQGKADNFTSRGGERMGQPSFLHPDNIASAQDWYFHWSWWGKNGPAQLFPTP